MKQTVASFLISLTFISCSGGGSRPAADDRPVPVEVLVLKETTLPRTRSFSASTMPWEMVVLSFKTTGRLKEIHFDEGSRITKGQLLARLDPVDQYMARQVAREQLRSLTPDVARLEKLAGKGAVPVAEKERVLGYRDALATQLSQADIALGATQLTAPCDGVIGRRMANPGEMMEPSRPLGVLLSMDPLKVQLAVRAAELAWFPLDREFRVIFPDRVTSGRVHQVSATADVVTQLFQITLSVANPQDAEAPLRAGQLARVEIDLPPLAGRFVPAEAIETGAAGMARLVGLVDGRLQIFLVRHHEREGRWVRVSGDLPADLQVVLDGFDLPARQRVTVKTTWTPETLPDRPED
ncbi:efflux RND transporter periplasmic adaptor subunit [Myxococcota bacterium]|nr:efflux RND transporter periplasmic adaptor subunit [Myxococcota bacterium]